jgi:hypothetical protein
LYLPIQEPVDEISLDELRKELATLEADEKRVFAERRRGSAASCMTHALSDTRIRQSERSRGNQTRDHSAA